ncbi:YaiI/YqxD family protein [Parvularcula sp. ZS-1/3]|uniref:UPF0178 protein HK107_08785 n=1 Tax=Parvularcula mediterranea TaxID=2732508 RepID=A0A7Y3RLW0_9PROT|nr:YaiI/YqxD family protein [Parvularcula mediterranea]NNU16414.1 YaiI/YqxD family protein [Parvularcula mediterranea]
MMTNVDALILVDADACPVKDEAIRVALRYGVGVLFVANQGFRLERDPLIRQHVVGGGFDEADDYVAELAAPGKVVVTADILLADRCLKAGAEVIGNNGHPFTKDTIGGAIAQRAIMNDLRGSGDQVGKGAPPFSKNDRSRFLQALDLAVGKAVRKG